MRASWHTPFFSWAKWGIAEGPLPLSVSATPPKWESVAGRQVCLFPDCDTHLCPRGLILGVQPYH